MAALDDLQNDLEADEEALSELNRRILSAVEAQYGPDSSEYELCAVRARGAKEARNEGRRWRHAAANTVRSEPSA